MSDDIKHHIPIYRNVFIALLILTVCTVGASYIHYSYAWVGLFVGLLIAFAKGYLVASLHHQKMQLKLALVLNIYN